MKSNRLECDSQIIEALEASYGDGNNTGEINHLRSETWSITNLVVVNWEKRILLQSIARR